MRVERRCGVVRCSRWCCAAREPLLEQDGGDDDHALGDGLGRGRQVVQREDVGERGEDQHAEDGADDGAAATGEQGAADDDGGDRVELVERAVGASCRSSSAPTIITAAMPQHRPDEDVEQHGVPLDVDAGQPGRLGVAADREGATAEGGAVEQDPADHRDQRRR